MNTNKTTVIGSVIIILVIISIPTVYKVVKNHQDSLFQVVEDKIINAAKKCYYEEKCVDDKIYLEELYKLDYLENISNPVSKEFYNVKSYVLREENKFSFIDVE